MALIYLLPSAITLAENGAHGGWTHGGRTCTVAKIRKPYGAWDDTTSNHADWDDATGPNGPHAMRCTVDVLPPVFAIQSVSLLVRIERSGGTFTGAEHRPFVYIGSTYYYVDAYTHTAFGYYLQTIVFATDPSTGVAWTRAGLNAAQWGLYAKNDDVTLSTGPFISALNVIVTATGAPDQIEQMHDVASRRLWRYRRNIRTMRMTVPHLIGHSVDPMGTLQITHSAAPDFDGLGWTAQPWDARGFQIRSWEPRDNGEVEIGGNERRPLRALYYDSAILPDNTSPNSEDGIIRFHRGLTFHFTCSSLSWTRDPGSGLITLVNIDTKQFGQFGYEAIGAYTNDIQYSAFQAGNITGWTKGGTGVSGSNVVSDTAFTTGATLGETQGWDSDSTGVLQNALFTAGTPHSADLTLTSTATLSYGSGSKVLVSYWFTYYTVGAPLYGALQRQVDSKYYNFSNNTWQAGIYWQDLTHEYGSLNPFIYTVNARGSIGEHQEWHFSSVDVGASATTLKTIFGFPNGTTSGVNARAYASQVVNLQGYYGLPPLLSTNASVVRATHEYYADATAAKPAVNLAQGALSFDFLPSWRASERPANTNHGLGIFYIDSNNYMALYWTNRSSASGEIQSGAGGAWVFDIKSGGNHYTTIVDTTVPGIEPNCPLRVVARWTGAQAEFGLTAYTAHVFFADARGNTGKSTGVVYVTPVGTDGKFQIGKTSDISGSSAGGVVTRHTSLPYVPTDEECYALIAPQLTPPPAVP